MNGDLPPEVWAEREVAATLNLHDLGSDTRSVELVVQAVHENQRGELTVSDTAGALKTGGGKPGQGYPTVAVTGERTHALTAEGHDASEDGTGRGTPIVSLAVAGDYSTSEDVAQTVRSANGQPGTIATETTVRRLTPMECERLQGFPDGWTETSNGQPQADSPRYKQMGNAVAVPVFEWVTRRLVAYEEER